MVRQGICVSIVALGCVLQALAQQPAPGPGRHTGTSITASDTSSQSLPDAPSSSVLSSRVKHTPTLSDPYVPLTNEEKFGRWITHTYSPYTFASVLMSATLAQMWGDWPAYGGGMEGFGKRFGATLADTEATGFFKVFLLPTILHQDPRYFAKRNGSVFARFWYAGTRTLVTRNDAGANTFNTSEVLGTLFVKSLANAYYPRRDRGFLETTSGTLGALLSDAGSNELREFWPDIRRTFRKHEPEKLKKLERRIPVPVGKVGGMGDE